MYREEIRKGDDKHHGGVLYIDDEVVADLWQNVPQRLGENHIEHSLDMVHANGLGSLRLAGVNGQNSASDRLRHIGAGVDGNHQTGRRPDIGELHGVVGEVRKAIVDKHRLQHHGRSPEHLHIDPHNHPDQRKEKPLDGMIRLPVGNRL